MKECCGVFSIFYVITMSFLFLYFILNMFTANLGLILCVGVLTDGSCLDMKITYVIPSY